MGGSQCGPSATGSRPAVLHFNGPKPLLRHCPRGQTVLVFFFSVKQGCALVVRCRQLFNVHQRCAPRVVVDEIRASSPPKGTPIPGGGGGGSSPGARWEPSSSLFSQPQDPTPPFLSPHTYLSQRESILQGVNRGGGRPAGFASQHPFCPPLLPPLWAL